MRKSFVVALAALAIAFGASGAMADTVSHSGSVSFTSDLEPDKVITLPSFDTTAPGGSYVLDSVTVEIYHSGSADIKGDNDDPFNTAQVNSRIIRTFQATGPGVLRIGTRTVQSGIVDLDVDDGDLEVFDPTQPDGTDFGGPLGYADMLAGVDNPSTNLYATAGAGTVDFTIGGAGVLTMVNDQQFNGPAPDAWQLEVENPILTVDVDITYDYHFVPEPGSLALLGLGGLALLRRRR